MILSIVFFVFAVLGAIDYLLGDRFGIGKEFKKGFMLLGDMALSMIGMIVLAPAIADFIEPVLNFTADVLHLDPSIIPASLFANDMGGTPLSVEVARDPQMGLFNGLIVAASMGAFISFTIPFSLGVVKKEQHRFLILGLLCGVVAIPVGCFAAGLVCKLPLGALLLNLLPLILLAGIVAAGLVFCREICVKIFGWFGIFIKLLMITGLLLGMVEFLFDVTVIPGLGSVEEGALICFNASVTLCGAFPMVAIVSRLIKKPLRAVGGRMGIDETSALGIFTNLVSNSPVFGAMDKMNEKGVVLNAAFAVTGAFALGAHLAFTKVIDPSYIVPMLVLKFVSGALALVLAWFVQGAMAKKDNSGTEKSIEA